MEAIDQKLEEQRRKLSEACSGDERRSITETVRHTRQEIARLRFHPDHRGRYLEHKLDDLIARYNVHARPENPTPQSERFDQQSLAAMNELRRRTTTAFDLAEIIIEHMDLIYWRRLWEKPDYVIAMFRQASQQRHLSKNNETFDLLVGDGENAIKANDVDDLRGIVLRLWDNQINTVNSIGDVGASCIGIARLTSSLTWRFSGSPAAPFSNGLSRKLAVIVKYDNICATFDVRLSVVVRL